MFFIFPVNTDAPIYHWPFVTVGIIAVNVLVFFGVADVESLVLHHDGGLHPVAWVTSNFAHANLIHLIGNMIFLWGFGLIVEGKTGWWRFLLIYLGIGMVQNVGEQIWMMVLGGGGGSLGASSVIFGLTAIAVVWAPRNEIECVRVFIFFFRLFISRFSVSILTFGGCYIGLDLLLAMLSGLVLSTSMLHLSGAVVGFAIGFAMLKLDLVDCEGWDILSVWTGRADTPLISEMGKPKVTAADVALGNAPAGALLDDEYDDEDEPDEDQRSVHEQIAEAHSKMRQAFHHGELEMAIVVDRHMTQHVDEWQMDRAELTHMIRILHTKERWTDSVPYMEDYLRQYPDTSGRLRVRLAQIYIVEQERPSKALTMLKEIRAGGLEAEIAELRRELMVEARKMIEDGVLELQDEP